MSAAEPERQHQMWSWSWAILSEARLATYVPVETRESATVREERRSLAARSGGQEDSSEAALTSAKDDPAVELHCHDSRSRR